jgi:hypothetical protein
MKDPVRLQTKLFALLKKRSDINVSFTVPCSEETFKEVVWIVKDYVTNSGGVINDDPLNEWLEEYQFFVNQ